MIKAIIIDDELHCIKTLNILLREYCPNVRVLEQCEDAETGMEAIKRLQPDVVFLDVEMPRINGFEMLEQLSDISFAIIFITSYDQYAIKAFRFSALDYLLKPVEPKELIAAVHKIETQKKLPEAEQFRILLSKMYHKETILPKIPVPTIDGYELVPAEQIIFCEANDDYTYFHLKDRRKIVACRSLKEVEEQLNSYSFFVRVHHSYILNLKEAAKYVRGEGGYVIMSNGTNINVSRSRKEALLKRFAC